MGTRSVLQAINEDDSAGPEDWTYWSTQHFYESSAGSWRIEISDERSTTLFVPPDTTVSATGSVTFVQLIVDGTPIVDADADGLDDTWEGRYFGGTSYGPKDDPDADGFNNAREQVMATDPLASEVVLTVDLAPLSDAWWRLSWPAQVSATYAVLAGDQPGPPWIRLTTNTPGRLPVAELVVPDTNSIRFFRVERMNMP